MSESADQVIAKDNFAQFKAANYPKLSDDDAFERFAMGLVLKEYGVGPAEIERGLVSSTDDGGIDGFYIFLNGSELVESDSVRLSNRRNSLSGLQTGVTLDIVIVQAKKESNWDTNVFPKIESALKAMLDTDQSEADLRSFPLNEKAVEKAIVLRNLRSRIAMLVPLVRVRVQYASFANQSNVENYMKTKARQLKKWLAENMPAGSNIAVEYLGDAELVTRLRLGTDFKAKLKLKRVPIRETNALVGLASIKDYLGFIRREKSKVIRDEMFAVNVRDYAGSNVRVNDAISRTLKTDSESQFWWLNNGITVIVDKADNPLELEWILTNPLIVNGLQTSHVIHETDLGGGVARRRLSESLLVRVIIESDPKVRESIINGTNNQTAIAGLQLHANEEKQLRIEEFLRASNWFYERRRYQYRGTKVPASRIRNMAEVGQAVMAYRLLQPDTARARPTTLLGSDSGWEKVFPPNESEGLYLKSLNVVEAVDDYLRKQKAKDIADDATNARYYLAAGYALRSSGVKKIEDFAVVPTSMLKAKPSESILTELHKLLYAEVARLDDGKTAMDKIFKGADLKAGYFDNILTANSK